MIIAWIAISWVVSFRGSLPYNRPLRAVTGFIEETRLAVPEPVPPDPAADRGRRAWRLDLSPMVGLILLFVVRAIVVGLIDG